MCVQYSLDTDLLVLEQTFAAELAATPETYQWKPAIFPRYQAPIVRATTTGRVIEMMQFGLIPPYERESKPKKIFHNARAETVHEKVSFRRAFEKGRCIVPVTSFCEHAAVSGSRVLTRFAGASDVVAGVAGVYSEWQAPDLSVVHSFALVTREPACRLDLGCERLPAFLDPSMYSCWLNPCSPAEQCLALLSATTESLASIQSLGPVPPRSR